MCYKIISGLVALGCRDFFSLHDVRTRGHNFFSCIYQIADLTCVNSALPGEFALIVWNNLPYDIVNAVSLNSFKRKLAILFVFDAHSASVVIYMFSFFRARVSVLGPACTVWIFFFVCPNKSNQIFERIARLE